MVFRFSDGDSKVCVCVCVCVCVQRVVESEIKSQLGRSDAVGEEKDFSEDCAAEVNPSFSERKAEL